MINPSTPEYAGIDTDEDPANVAAQKIAQEGIRVTTSRTLPLGVVGVFSCFNDCKGEVIGYHSVVGMEQQAPIQVLGLEGNMAFSPLPDTQARVQYLDQLPKVTLHIGRDQLDAEGQPISPFKQ